MPPVISSTSPLRSANRHVLILLAVLFGGELTIMLMMSQLGAWQHLFVVALIDAALVALLAAPFLWRFLIKPCQESAVQEATRFYREELAYRNNHDALTELPNRTLLTDRVLQAIQLSRRTHLPFALYCVDIDHFKLINDSFGHSAGDYVLQQVAKRLGEAVRAVDTVARYGADEFCIISAEPENVEAASMVARRIREVLASRPIIVNGHELAITASIGIGIFPRDGADAESLLMHADTAMHNAKELGRDTFQFFNAVMNTRTLERVTMEARLRKALDNNEFVLLYQPKVNLVSGMITGVEALIRWQNPEMGLVSPSTFIPLAEESGLIEPITDWVLSTACRDAASWHRANLLPITVAVNISARQFRRGYLNRAVDTVLQVSGLDPGHLELEITESILMHDLAEAVPLLRELKQQGVLIGLDDFGTGYSSLSYLKRFPVDKIKLDQSFVHDITTDPDSAAIARAVLAMAHSLQHVVIAEGVETEGQLEYLRRLGCDEIQGYYAARPMPADELRHLLLKGGLMPELLSGHEESCILVVDDEPGVLHALERHFMLEGHQILTADCGSAALDILAVRPVAVLISDYKMPGMDGIELLRRARDLHPNTVRILITGYADIAAAISAINEVSAFKFVTKPWDEKQLRTCITEAFRYHRFLRSSTPAAKDTEERFVSENDADRR